MENQITQRMHGVAHRKDAAGKRLAAPERERDSSVKGITALYYGTRTWVTRYAVGVVPAMKTIKDLPEHSRPREKLQERGASALTDEELVAAILGRGILGIDVRTIARQVAGLIREHKRSLTLGHLTAVPGIKLAKGAQILSAFELARRYLLKETVKIACAQDLLPLVADIAAKPQEHFVCLSLNGANELIAKRLVSMGLQGQAPAAPREVFPDITSDPAAAVIFVHNHRNS